MWTAGNLLSWILLSALTDTGGGYVAKSNREEGNGRYDICVYNRSDYRKSAEAIELKKRAIETRDRNVAGEVV